VQTTGIQIDWDGEHLPKELAELPPGRYQLLLINDTYELSDEEETFIQEGLDDLAAGRVVPYEDVVQRLQIHPRRE